jgi:hypothetical protein
MPSFGSSGAALAGLRVHPPGKHGAGMRQDIRHAGLTPDVERRLKLAARTLSLHGMDASVEPWKGSGCRLVVIGVDDAYGRHVLDIARRRRVPTIAVGADAGGDEGVQGLAADASVSALAAALQASLQRSASGSTINPRGSGSASVDAVRAANDGWLQILARDQLLSRHPVRVRHGSRSLFILPERGRVYAATRSDLIEMRDRCSQSGFELSELASERDLPANVEVSEGLDAFFVSSAIRSSARLPRFEDVPCRLEHWPDLATADDAPQALRIAAPMMRGAHTVRELAASLGVDEVEVSACFWAFCAAGLLHRQSGTTEPPASAGRAGVWSRLAHRFGLS